MGDNLVSATADKGLMEAMIAFDSVGDGDKVGYEAAIVKARGLVTDPILQYAMCDCIIAARVRAYGDQRAPKYRRMTETGVAK